MTSFDCVVIGSGPGGYVAAIRAAQLGLKTAVVERDRIGGRCLNDACIPAKAVLRAADVLQEVRDAGEFGIGVSDLTVDFHAVGARRVQIVETLTGGVAGLLRQRGVEVIASAAALAGDGRIRLRDGALLTAKAIIVATGSVPRPIPGVGFGGRVIGTEEAWRLPELPSSLAVVGAGASGTEIASAYARLGSRVMLFEALDRVLAAEDADISRTAERSFKRQGIDVHTGTLVQDVRSSGDAVSFSYGDERGEAEYLVIAAGRGPDVDALGLAGAGVVRDEHGRIAVGPAMRTSAAGVWAIGDVVAGPALAHKASDEGIVAAEDAAGLPIHPLRYADIPRATFCTPNVASFGLTEAAARAACHDVVVGKVPYGAVGAGTVYGDRTGLVKIVGDATSGALLGGHIVGAKATELIQQLVNVRALGGGYRDVARTIHGHPTLSEALMEAARAADGWVIHG